MGLEQTSASGALVQSAAPLGNPKVLGPEDALQFIVNLVNRGCGDLNAPGRRDMLIYEVERWLDMRPGSFRVAPTENPDPHLHALAKQLRERMTMVMDAGFYKAGVKGIVTMYRLPEGRFVWTADMPIVDMIDSRLMISLSDKRAESLRRCVRKQCRELFLAGRKDTKHCNVKCSNAESAARKRERDRQEQAKTTEVPLLAEPKPSTERTQHSPTRGRLRARGNQIGRARSMKRKVAGRTPRTR